ncbi:hypothetical protein [Fimbriiglobus ruber]|uniref:ATP-grasp domain-containing protein n=1 Tax=Fimbriiglobus ruber TaxID=1908690 RepID=A0A225EH61_9BACT|nr:hypothetical protein [Fimbriiglobus ruber]OWK47527.1 hypothetical protein FRUB_01226 [Fimbriiglobus ruber]
MSSDNVLLIGLDAPEVAEIRDRVTRPLIVSETLPKLQMHDGDLFVYDWARSGRFVPVSKVVFHAIFENDLPILAALALWGGPCLPGAHGMLDCRPRIPNLARVRKVSRFAAVPRGYADRGTTFTADRPTIAKWGEWHCGEGKEKFVGEWNCTEPTLFEPFLEGEAVRVQLIGTIPFQIRLGGDDWKKSLHHKTAAVTAIDPDLLADTFALQAHFGLEVCAVDYIVAPDGTKHLLELNHIPNVLGQFEIFPKILAV